MLKQNHDHTLLLRWQNLCHHVASLSAQYPNKTPVTILAVSKYAKLHAMETLYQAGQRDFAENYWQTAKEKMHALKHLDIRWHFIGQLQSNKCREIASRVSWVHSVTQLKQIPLLAKNRSADLPPLAICLQVNLSSNPHKYGVKPEDIFALVSEVLNYSTLQLSGLMLLPHPNENTDFAKLAKLRDTIEKKFTLHLPHLSMGMSADYEQAIKHGATLIRVGSLLFRD